MKSPFSLLFLLLPYAVLADYDESSTRRIKLEDIEDEHIQNERQSKSLPPPLSQQPAKGQPANLYPSNTNEEYQIGYLSDTHRYSTRAHHHVQPLTDQPTAPEAEYHQSPAYQRETLVYLPANAHGQPHLHENVYAQQQQQQQQMMYDAEQQQQQQQQPSPHFYYSHDVHQQQQTGNDYQIQFIPIGQNGGSAEHQQQHVYAGPSQVTVPSTAAPSIVPVAYSHDVAYGGAQPEVQQHQDPVQYVTANDIREPHTLQQVYGLPADVLFQSQKDIVYAQPAQSYGPPLEKFNSKPEYSQRDYSQDIPQPKPTPSYQPEATYLDQSSSGGYESQPSKPNEGPSQPQQQNQQKEYTYTQPAEPQQKEAISYGYESQTAQSILSPSKTQTSDLSYQNVVKYPKGGESDEKSALSYGYETELAQSSLSPSETQTNYLNHQKEIKVIHGGDKVQKPAITYGPPDTVGQELPKIQYGAPDVQFRRPVAQSNQDSYAPRRPASSARSNEKPFVVNFPYPPSFVSITTESYEKPTPAPEPLSNNDVNPWRPLHVPSQNQHRSLGPVQEPLIDFFQARHAKSLLDSYIPSWQVTQMQKEHARQLQLANAQQQQQQHTHTQQSYQPQIQQSYAIPSPEADNIYNTIAYSTQYDHIYGNQFKRSTRKKEQKKKVSGSTEEKMTAMA